MLLNKVPQFIFAHTPAVGYARKLDQRPSETDVRVETRTGGRNQIGRHFRSFRQIKPSDDFFGALAKQRIRRRKVAAAGGGSIEATGRRTRPEILRPRERLGDQPRADECAVFAFDQ